MKIEIEGKLIEKGEKPYFIAEIGANHNGDMDLCKRIIDSAIESGADAVKFQSWSKKSIVSTQEFKRNTSYFDKKRHFGSLEEMVEKYQLTPKQHQEIFSYCTSRNVTFLSSCFTNQEVDMLEEIGVAAHKIASMDINNLPLLDYVGSTKKPVLLSTGMSTLGEIERAVNTLERAGSEQILLFHCVSIYPPKLETINLKNIPMLEKAFELPIGFSDHTIGTSIPLAAISLGAVMIEKHFTIDKELPGWDHAISANPEEFAYIANEGRNIWEALGTTRRIVSNDEMEKRKVFRRRIVLKKSKNKGEIIKFEDIDFKRPGNGIHPDEYPYIVGRQVNKSIESGAELEWNDFE